MDYLDTLKRNSNNSFDYVYKTIKIKNHRIDLVNIETITSSELINDFILKKLSYLSNYSFNDLEIFLLNYLPVNSITKLNNFEELTETLKSLGYKPNDIKKVLPKLDASLSLEKQVKEALKLLLK